MATPVTDKMAPKKRRRKQPNKTVIQNHHISYNPEWIVSVFKGEHYILSLMSWRKRTSAGFITALKEYIHTHEADTVNLGPEKKEDEPA
jgi:frataxin-like iron-binding protein CyaY